MIGMLIVIGQLILNDVSVKSDNKDITELMELNDIISDEALAF